MIQQNRLYTISDAAKILGISRSTLIRWIKNGIIKATLPETSTTKVNPRILGKDLKIKQ